MTTTSRSTEPEPSVGSLPAHCPHRQLKCPVMEFPRVCWKPSLRIQTDTGVIQTRITSSPPHTHTKARKGAIIKAYLLGTVKASRHIQGKHFWPSGWIKNPACQASLFSPTSQSLLKFMSIASVMPSNHLTLCPLLLLPPSIFSSIRVFCSESALCIRWPECWSFSFSISPFNEYPG